MSEAIEKDPAVMTPAEVAQKLWAIGHTEPLDIPTLMIWCGIACAKLMDKSRAPISYLQAPDPAKVKTLRRTVTERRQARKAARRGVGK